ncbi:TonB-dependent receptor [Tenacibaculum tangerinum]|uniref:TonB-dependent receptor n=1 Tax=Tenacibaculum tangerinum TaxID=3038772 RepID=A0ABY8L3N4_9FLAO|nr:TonB-dependent receptor [Tenacibaculum tangerinum]WGH76042.1 TonB-dependent receptor [Tenacibaculum tangerinum]
MIRQIKLFILLFFPITMLAQSITVSGLVTDKTTGSPLPGVNILIKGEEKGTQTDFNGNYTLNNVDTNATLVYSFIGFKTQELKASSEVINVVLEESLSQLDEVVVIGYGSKSRKDVTGAVSLVGAKTIDKLKPVDASLALQGTTSGVTVNTPSGSPGAGFDIVIRGISSNGKNGPLIVVDGLPNADFNSINPNDIESISVLKDAQAAIYGIQGANGVVIIKTKSGKKNTKTKVTYDVFTGVQQTSKKLDNLNAIEYALLLNESYAANGQDLPYPNINDVTTNTDWQDELFSSAFMINHNLGISGGSENITYFLGASHLSQDGIIAPEKSTYERNNVRLTLGVDLSDKFKITSTTNYFTTDRKSINENGLGSVLFNALNYAPTFSLEQEDLSGFLGNEVINPLSQIKDTYNSDLGTGLEGSLSLDFIPSENLKVTSRLGYKTFNNRFKGFFPVVNYGPGKVFNRDRSEVNQSRQNFSNYTWETFINYKNTFDETHNLSLTLGTSVQKQIGEGLYATGYDVPNNSWDFADISLTTGILNARTNDSYRFDNRLLSYFGRVEYDYKSKYLISAMIRRDAASDFNADNRVDYFPSVTAGWKISDEEFMSDNGFVDFLKLRASYGFLGNFVGDNLYRAELNGEGTYVFDNSIVNGVAIGRLPNPDARWERAEKLDIGLDAKFLDNKLELVADYFIEDRNDLLISGIPVSGIVGTYAPGSGNPIINAGTSRVKGFELGLKFNNSVGDDFNYAINYNLTKINGEVTKINGGIILEGGAFGVGQLAPSRMKVGEPIGYFYGLQTDGIFQTVEEVNNSPSQTGLLGNEAVPGDIKYVDVNGDGVINFDDRTKIGNPQAEFIMGLNLSFNYKNWDFSSYMYSELNKDMVRNYERDQPNVNKLAYNLDRWTGPGTSNTVPRVTTGATNNRLFSSFFVEDASFLRLQNIQIGYTLPSEVLEKLKISKVRLYTTVNNAFTLTNYKGFDPAATGGTRNPDGTVNPIGLGIDYGIYPVSRQYLLGLNVAF